MRLLLFILTFCVFSFTSTSSAQSSADLDQQTPKSGTEQMEDTLQKMKTDLSLSVEQVEQLRTINTDFSKKIETAISADKTAMRKKIIAYKAEKRRAYQQHLTPEQFEVWQQTKKSK